MRGDGAFSRAPRPLMGWVWLAAGLIALSLLVLLFLPLYRALNRWADGEPIDMQGLAAVLGVMVPIVTVIITQGVQYMHTRHRERMDQQARGVAPDTPFAPAPPLPTQLPPHEPGSGPLVNERAL